MLPATSPIATSRMHQGSDPSTVRTEKRTIGMRATPAGSEMNVRTTGSSRAKNTVGVPQRSNQRCAYSTRPR